ncbi:MAG: SagB family peptide dehydrogenase, partial [Pseudomarimonas sp.]
VRGDWVVARDGECHARMPGELSRAGLALLKDGACQERKLIDALAPQPNPAARALAFAFVDALDGLGFLRVEIFQGGSCLAVVEPCGVSARVVQAIEAASETNITDHDSLQLRWARTTVMRHDGGTIVMENAACMSRLRLIEPSAVTLAATLRPTRSPDRDDVDSLMLSLMLRLGLVEARDAVVDDVQSKWDFHDMFFHARSRSGRFRAGLYADAPDHPRKPPPARPEPYPTPLQRLPHTTPVTDSDTAFPIGDLLRRRRSTRDHSTGNLPYAMLGPVLALSSSVVSSEQRGALSIDARPYPSGGASYELEVYLAVRRVEHVAPGFYHYDAQQHGLRSTGASEHVVARMVGDAMATYGGTAEPQLLVVLAARFERVMWKYDSLAYALTLKHVGVVFQTMCLVATALGIGSCPIGSGNTRLFGQATGRPWLVESSVGEMIVGLPSVETAS